MIQFVIISITHHFDKMSSHLKGWYQAVLKPSSTQATYITTPGALKSYVT